MPARPVGPAAIGSAALVLVALVLVAQTLVASFAYHTALPQEDEWSSLFVFRSVIAGQHVLADLFSQHNEHRIFFPRLILFSDYLFFGGSGRFDLVVIFTIQALLVALFWHLLSRSCAERGGRIALGAVVPMLLFSLHQSENLLWGFQVQFVGVFAAGSLAIALFAAALERSRAPRSAATLMAASFVLVGVASFSMSNGLLSGVVLVVMALLVRAPWRRVMAAAAVAAGSVALFAFHYDMLGGDALRSSWSHHPMRVPLFAAAYLGGFNDSDMTAAIVFGACGLVAMAAMFGAFAVGRDTDRMRLALLGIALFTAGSAVLTALGRSGEGLGAAMASRYVTGAASFWSALLIGGWSSSSAVGRPGLPRLAARVGCRVAVAGSSLVLLTAVVTGQAASLPVLRDRAFRNALIEDALDLGLLDTPVTDSMDDNSDWIHDIVPLLKERDISIFRARDAHLIGRPLAEAGSIDAHPCAGTFDIASAAPGLGRDGVRASGEARLGRARDRSGRIYIVGPAGTVVGLASTPESGTGWSGYATAPLSMPLRAFARLGSGRLCEVGGATVAGDGPVM